MKEAVDEQCYPLPQLAGNHGSLFEGYFQQLDVTRNGRIDASSAAAFLKKSQLGDPVLHKVSAWVSVVVFVYQSFIKSVGLRRSVCVHSYVALDHSMCEIELTLSVVGILLCYDIMMMSSLIFVYPPRVHRNVYTYIPDIRSKVLCQYFVMTS